MMKIVQLRRRLSRWWLVAAMSVGSCVLPACGGDRDDDSQEDSVQAQVPGQGQPPAQEQSPACKASREDFAKSIWPTLSRNCVDCHRPGGAASSTGLVFAASGTQAQGFETLRSFASNRRATLLAKSIGLSQHGGGAPLQSASSDEYKALAAWSASVTQAGCSTVAGGAPPATAASGYWSAVRREAPSATLARAAVLLAARNPSAEELQKVRGGDPAALKRAIRGYMEGGPFMGLMHDVGSTQFLSPGVVVIDPEEGLHAGDWPMAASLLGAAGAQVDNEEKSKFEAAIRQEPVELLKFIVRNDRPYTDMVRGNYTVANPVMVKYLGATTKGSAQPGDDGWLEATLPNKRTGGLREHAGVLSTHAWLQRFPTTDTNRNRHRVHTAFRQFLATDIEQSAKRPLDDTVTFKVPTVENPACSVCHSVMDPIAAGFQNWNEANRYRPNTAGDSYHALPGEYLNGSYPKDANSKRYYQVGDNWFRDQAAPGYGATPMPGGFGGSDTALQWVGRQIAEDSRFPLGAVHFFYKGIFGQAPLSEPQPDPSNPQYASQAADYRAQSEEFLAIASAFATNRGRGAYNVKDLLVDLLTSNTVTAERTTSARSEATATLLHQVGAVGLLSPSRLNRKLGGLVGVGFKEFDTPYTGLGLRYGEFDGVTSLTPAQEFTLMQWIVVERMSLSIACAATSKDFAMPANRRLLFPHVALSDVGAAAASKDAIALNVAHLHKQLWQRDVTAADPEVQRTAGLFMAVMADKAKPAQRATQCQLTDKEDPTYAGRAWSAVLAYMIADPDFLFR